MKRLGLMCLMLFWGQWALADAAADIKYRESVMKVVGGHMSAMGTILRGRIRMSDFKFHAEGMADIAKIVPTIFPKGSGDGKTEALSAIWDESEKFEAAVKEFVDAANGMAKAAESSDNGAIGPAMKALGGACKGCHDNFREDHDH